MVMKSVKKRNVSTKKNKVSRSKSPKKVKKVIEMNNKAKTSKSETSTTKTDSSTTKSKVVETPKTAVETLKNTKTYAPNSLVGTNCNIEIDGFQFVAEEITATESYPRKELVRTAIMGGGQYTAKGQYVPRTYSFTTTLDYPDGKPDMYDKLWEYMQNKECKVVCQFTGNFTSEVQIVKTYPKGSFNTVKLTITLTEISQADNTYTVKTDMTGFTSLTDNSDKNIIEMEDDDGNIVTVQKNVSKKHTADMSKGLKKVSKSKKKSTSTDSTDDDAKADSTKTDSKTKKTSKKSVKFSTKKSVKDTKEHSKNNTEAYISKDVSITL